ncbi:UNVERIFIED_CONTAM: hypothetical protein GTU68_062847 [Idotea baltica]|nr:hypothetical protein [Idotea baltica]
MSKKIKKRDLGLGIKALLSSQQNPGQALDANVQNDNSDGIKLIPLAHIEVNPDQPRRGFNDETIDELSKSIKTYGLIQPITVRRLSTDRYQIISGERRYKASQIAGLIEVPAYVRTANDQELLEMGLVENIQREDLNAIDIAISYQRLINECNLTHDDLSERIGKKRSTISNYVRLLKLPPELQKALKQEFISMGHARALAGVDRIGIQLLLCDRVIRHNWSVRKLEAEIKALDQPKTVKNNPSQRSTEIVDVEKKLKQVFGSTVRIILSSNGKGSIKIDFGSTDQLNDILEQLDELE